MNPTEPNPPSSSAPATSGKAALGWFLAIAVVILAWAGAYALRNGGQDVELTGWAHGLDEGKAKAQEDGRPMVVLFTATWCGPCQHLKQTVLTQPKVHDALQAGYVPVKVDMSNADISDPLIKQYQLEGWPTVIVMSADGTEIKRFAGTAAKPAQSPEDFINWLSTVERQAK